MYEVLWFDGWGMHPAYYLLSGVEGESPEEALKEHLSEMIQEVRELFDLSPDEVSDEKIQETLYVLRSDALIPTRDLLM